MENLDSMTKEELWDFWSQTNSVRPIAFARTLFTGRPKGYVSAAKDLGCYAINKATAMSCRLEGKISQALMYEDICDSIYKRLPEYAQW